MCENFEEKWEVWEKGKEMWKLSEKVRGVRKSETCEKKIRNMRKGEKVKVRYVKKWDKCEQSVRIVKK